MQVMNKAAIVEEFIWYVYKLHIRALNNEIYKSEFVMGTSKYEIIRMEYT